MSRLTVIAILVSTVVAGSLRAEPLPVVDVEGQPLAANVARVLTALETLGAPLSAEASGKISELVKRQDAAGLQRAVDEYVALAVVVENRERMKVIGGPAGLKLQQAGYLPVIVKVINPAEVTGRLKITSPQAGPPYAGVAKLSLERQQQTELGENQNTEGAKDRFLAMEMLRDPPLSDKLSGLEAEYLVAIIYSSDAGQREATIGFELTANEQVARGEAKVQLDVAPAIPVKVIADDENGEPTIVRLLIKDEQGRVYPPQARRLAPDLFFQPHIYRARGESVLLPPGKFTVWSSRGPEYRVKEQSLDTTRTTVLDIDLDRWIDMSDYGFYSGDHHIHAAGCAHYSSPTEGVTPEDMFRQVKGEGLNVGSVLTWGPCFRYQRQFFGERPHGLSEPLTLLKYDIEVSGFGSQALGHTCLLNLKDHVYPGSDGLETKGWPTWTVPVLRWCKEQGGVTGYAHSASGMWINEKSASERLMTLLDSSQDGALSAKETEGTLLPEPFDRIDADRSGSLGMMELIASHARAAEQLPNYAIPEMNGVGAMELPVAVAEGVCDFISAMDTRRIQEWNTWYHVLNCGFPLKASGETDFPCMSSRNVGQGRVYVRVDELSRGGSAGASPSLDYAAWCEGLRAGRSYVSDGYAHAVEFAVGGVRPGDGDIRLDRPGTVRIAAAVAFAEETPLAVAHGGITPPAGKSVVGDTVVLHGPRSEEMLRGGKRLVEIVVNGQPVASQEVEADGKVHELRFDVPIERSSWVALRHFPQLHTNPVNVIVGGRPIRASRASAQWCQEVIDLLWKNRERAIAEAERPAARAAYDRALAKYQKIEEEAGSGR